MPVQRHRGLASAGVGAQSDIRIVAVMARARMRLLRSHLLDEPAAPIVAAEVDEVQPTHAVLALDDRGFRQVANLVDQLDGAEARHDGWQGRAELLEDALEACAERGGEQGESAGRVAGLRATFEACPERLEPGG